MSLTKVFNVTVDYGRTPPHQCYLVNAAIEREMERLAKEDGVALVFHSPERADMLGGGIPLLAEMPEEFAQKVAQIKDVERVQENTFYKTTPRLR
jgi:hypothetical protein